jgi:hypothetical protein
MDLKRRISALTIVLLLIAGFVFAGSQQTSSTPASTIITRARYHVNEATASFWSDTELLAWVNQGIVDIGARTKCLESSESVTLIGNTYEYTIAGTYIDLSTVVYNDAGGAKKGLVRKNPQSIGNVRAVGEPVFWYEWAGKVGVYPMPPVITSAGLAIGSTTTAVSTTAFAYYINNTVYTKAAVVAGTAPGNDVIPQSKYGAVAFDIGVNGTIDAVEAYSNAVGYTSAALAVSGLPPVEDEHVRLGYVTATKTDGAFTFGTTALNAVNSTVAYTSSAPTLTVYFTSRPTTIALTDNVLTPAIYDRALTLYVAAQALLKEKQYGQSARLMGEYLAEIDRFRRDFVERLQEPESSIKTQ